MPNRHVHQVHWSVGGAKLTWTMDIRHIFALDIEKIVIMSLVLVFRLFKENKLFDYFVVKTESLRYFINNWKSWNVDALFYYSVANTVDLSSKVTLALKLVMLLVKISISNYEEGK